MIAGLYPYRRGGRTSPPVVTLAEIPRSLEVNPLYHDRLLVLAGERASQVHLESFGLRVHRVFDDAPETIHRDAAHKMKHWMCRWALEEFGEFLWVDWDTVCLSPPDEAFWAWARDADVPRFIRVPDYHATVNCGVYYAPRSWAGRMNESFGAVVTEPNDELLWRSVLPEDVVDRPEYWWGDRVVHVQTRNDFGAISEATYFAHVKELGWAGELRRLAAGDVPRGRRPVASRSREIDT